MMLGEMVLGRGLRWKWGDFDSWVVFLNEVKPSR